ncbi:MAG: HK97 family phage prohead protease [Ilumatobacteraceae bacterium]
MPWEIIQEDPACPASRPFGVHKVGDGELEGCHASYADADDQMSALYMAESEDDERAADDTYEPPRGVQNAAQRALEWIAEGLAGDGFTDVGRARASQLANGEPVSRETIGRMANYFGRHASDRNAEGFNAGEDGFPSPGRVAWDAWGGDAGRSWSQGIIDAEDGSSMDRGEHLMDTYHRTEDGVTVPDREVRRVERLELRQSDDGLPMIEGYATVYDYRYDIGGGPDMGGFTEVIATGAASKSAQEADVRLLANHGGLPLARTRSGTLQLESDDIGLKVRATLDPTNPAAQEVRSAMERGDVDQMSFAFRVVRDQWNADYSERTISEVKLFDVSVVTYPANPATVVKLRADDQPAEDAAEEAPKASGRSVAQARRQASADRARKRR